jgi:PPOX class probable F420-dependent enzyme
MKTVPTSHGDLLDAEFATLATLGPDGRPQLTEVWFLAEDGVVRISLNTSRQKVKNLLSNPACALLIVDPANPYRYLEIRGDAEIVPDAHETFADRVDGVYQADHRDHDGPGSSRVIVTVRPTTINAVTMRE